MKLINKKTGEIAEIKLKLNESLPDGIRRTIEEAGWEETREPLIKNEKMRKAVKAWAEINKYERLSYWCKDGESCFSFFDIESENEILFDNLDGLKGLIDDRTYAITELCGEEEE